ncbi:MAG: hypothetical protein EOO38_12085 [Cytophagaceae bacterium]|nr:MAG: hypothetical protein EOO38_12085 [Cytophagaceae bacterium]
MTSSTLTLGSSAGSQTVRAAISGANVTFTATATAGAIATIVYTTQPATTANADTAIASFQVTARDSFGNTVSSDSSSSVTLAAFDQTACAGSTVASSLSVTSQTLSSGVATFSSVQVRKTTVRSIRATLGSHTVCSTALTVSPGALSSLVFTTEPSSTVTAGTNIATQPVVTAYDAQGNVKTDFVSGVAIAAQSSTTCSSANDIASGVTPTSQTASSGVATYSGLKVLKTNAVKLRASSGSVQVCSQSFTMSAGPAKQIFLTSGNSQTDTVNTLLGQAFTVTLKDVDDNIVSGASVSWTITAGNGSLSSGASTTSNASGISTNSFTLGTTAGTNTITASIPSTPASVTFTATGTPGAISQINVVSGNSQSGTAGSALASPFIAVVQDSYGNAIASASTTWAVVTGGGSISPSSVTANASGQSSSTLNPAASFRDSASTRGVTWPRQSRVSSSYSTPWFEPSELEDIMAPLRLDFMRKQADKLEQAKVAYDQLNEQLMSELPQLIDLRYEREWREHILSILGANH